MASTGPVTIRKRLAQTAAGTLILVAALIAVGLTAPVDGPFTIDIKPVFLRLDAAALAKARGEPLGLDIDVKIGGVHLHFAWSAVPMSALLSSTKDPRELL